MVEKGLSLSLCGGEWVGVCVKIEILCKILTRSRDTVQNHSRSKKCMRFLSPNWEELNYDLLTPFHKSYSTTWSQTRTCRWMINITETFLLMLLSDGRSKLYCFFHICIHVLPNRLLWYINSNTWLCSMFIIVYLLKTLDSKNDEKGTRNTEGTFCLLFTYCFLPLKTKIIEFLNKLQPVLQNRGGFNLQ